MGYRAIFFDAGGTLLKPHPSVGKIYAQTARRYGMRVDADRVDRIFRFEFSKRDKLSSTRAHSSEKNEREWWKVLVRDVFRQVTAPRNFDLFFDDLYDLFATARVWKLYPEARRTLRALKKKRLVLGIVSNWDRRLFSICKEMRLDRYFQFILASAVVGSAKPNRLIFEKALALSRVAPHEALHVGDSVENDVEGARRAGIDALLVDRGGRKVRGVHVIPSLEGIMDRLDDYDAARSR